MDETAHHAPDGTFRNPWEISQGDAGLRGRIREVAWDWITGDHPPDPEPRQLPAEGPNLSPAPAAGARVTWVGHATTLIRLPGLTLLTDPVWSERCSPVPFWGPKRFVPAVPALEELPKVDAVLLSHDHFDHLDRSTVAALHRRFGEELTWFTPLGYRDWFRGRGITRVEELDWWGEAELHGYRIVCTPARHWTRRTPWGTNRRLWSGWAVVPVEADPAMDSPTTPAPPVDPASSRPPRLWFAGDSGWCPAFAEIGERLGPFDLSMVPVGAYEPRWFMKAAHMNPEEAVRAFQAAGGAGIMIPIHWGTWRLTFEDPLEPRTRTRVAWGDAGLDPGGLALLRHGETVTVGGG